MKTAADARPEIEVPDKLRAGSHGVNRQFPTEVLDANMRQHSVFRRNTGPLGNLTCPFTVSGTPNEPYAGYDFDDEPGCDTTFVAQLIVSFDLEWLRGVRNNVIQADLLFDERIEWATNDDGEKFAASTCIGRLGIAPTSFQTNIANDQLIPTDGVQGDRLVTGNAVTPSRWDVTRDIRWHATGQNEPLPGIVIHGPDENLGAETDRSCMSSFTNVRLELQYEIFR